MRRKKLKKKFYIIINCICVCFLSFGLIFVFRPQYENHKNEILIESVKTIFVEKEENEIIEDKIREFNGDIVAWLKIDDLIDLPVMWTPEEPEYYLRRAIDKTYSVAGSLFIGEECNLDVNSLIIYGHNMKNGTMFAPLLLYKDKNVWERHNIIELETMNEKRQYQIFSVMETEINEDILNYYAYTGNITLDEMNQLLNIIDMKKCYDTSIEVNEKDTLLILSTCSYHAENGRFVVFAKRV